MKIGTRTALVLSCALLASSAWAQAESTAFTYQGDIKDGGTPANGNYDLTFGLYASSSGGSSVGAVLTNSVGITNGLLTATLDFGHVFDGTAYWLEIGVQSQGGTNGFVLLSPRQSLTPVPYALHALSATMANNTTGAIADNQLSSNVARLNGSATFAGSLTASSFNGNGAGLNNLSSTQLTNLSSTLFAGPALGRLLNNPTSIVAVVFGQDSEADDSYGAHGGIPADMIRSWEEMYGYGGSYKQGESLYQLHNGSVWAGMRTDGSTHARPEGTNFIDLVAVLYASDGLSALYNQDDRLAPGPVDGIGGTQDDAGGHPWRSTAKFYQPVTEWGVRVVGNTNSGLIKIIHTNEFGSETVYVDCQRNYLPSVTNVVVYTNFNMGTTPSVFNSWEIFSVTGTNIVLGVEALNTVHGGVAAFHWGHAGLGLSDWVITDTNYPGVLYNLFASIQPSISILISKHLPGGHGGDSTYTNDYQKILRFMHGSYTPAGQYTNNVTANNYTVAIGSFPTYPDTNHTNAEADLRFVKACVAGMPGGGTNFFVLDLLSKFTNDVYVDPMLVDVQHLHPTIQASPFALEANRQLGMELPSFREGYGLSSNVIIGPNMALQVRNGKVEGAGPIYTVASSPSVWAASAGAVYSGTNVQTLTGLNGAQGIYNGNHVGMLTNELNGYNAAYLASAGGNTAGFYNGGVTRDFVVDAVNHTDMTLFLVAKSSAAATKNVVLSCNTADGNYIQATLSYADGLVHFLSGTNLLTVANDTTTGYAIYRFQRTGTNMVIAKNGQVIGSLQARGIALGSNSFNAYWGGDFGAQYWVEGPLLYARGLSFSEVYQTEKNLSTKYNLPLGDGSVPYTLAESGVTGLVGDLAAKAPATNPIFGGTITGNAGGLTNLNAANLVGIIPAASFPATLPAVSGANLTSLNGAHVTSGTINSNALDAPTRAQLALAGAVSSPISTAIAIKTTDYTLTAADSTILVNGVTKTMTLPTAVGISGRQYTIELIAVGTTATVGTSNGQNINGGPTYSLAAQYNGVTVQSDGSQWWIISKF
jgi:hypothetical protein